MKLPSTTSGLLALQEATNAELRGRLTEVFFKYRWIAFLGRRDNLFTEHWTPELAAARYDFEAFDVRGDEIVLHGIENAFGFIYRISIALPLAFIDDGAAIEAYFQRVLAESNAESEYSNASSPVSSIPPAAESA